MFYEAPLLKPYVFFDVAAGREAGGGGGSRSKTNRVSCPCPVSVLSVIMHSIDGAAPSKRATIVDSVSIHVAYLCSSI